MGMSAIETTRTVAYSGSVELQLQQKQSKVAHLAQQFNLTGKKVELEDQFGQAQAQDADVRHGPTKESDMSHARRWVAQPRERYFNKYLDNDDELATKIDVRGAYSMTGAATIRRVWDEAWFLGFYGNNLTGEDGGTSTPFTSGNISAVSDGGGGNGLTVEKIMWGRRKLTQNLVDLDEEMPVIIITAAQVDDLLKQVEVTSRDYNLLQEMAMQTGTVQKILGCLFVGCEYGNATSFPKLTGGTAGGATDLTVDGSGYRRVPMFVPSGMAFNTWQRQRSKVNERPDLTYAWQVFAGTTVGACRMMEEKCLMLTCQES